MYLILVFICSSGGPFLAASGFKHKYDEKYFLTYRYSTTTQASTPRHDPDSLFFGFFPIWSAILVALTGFCLFVSLIGVCCWIVGLKNPRTLLHEEAKKCRKKIEKEQQIKEFLAEEQFYDDISMRMLDSMDKNASISYASAKLITESEYESKIYVENKKKRFMRDHL
ncbi:hypothetical protein BpHYR1_005409 [Brachionus plicatilis]|uniref:Uncharacterized protein n=1 Tax=Brachionus plicatilis TaxID=10195 RepID=A0A3M7P7H6_BRAPC|nr:hypothetical protein BpHYR1_005409 [Brachionus plicatilis]